MNIATDQEMRSAVERWAQVRGFNPRRTGFEPGRTPWAVDLTAAKMGLRPGPLLQRLGADGKYQAAWENVSDHAALVWALVLEARPLQGRCKRCRGRGTWDQWMRRTRLSTFTDRSNYRYRAELRDDERNENTLVDEGFRLYVNTVVDPRSSAFGSVIAFASRAVPCLDCDGTGLADLTDAYAQHVLDAQPRAIGGLSFTTPTASGIGATLSTRADGANSGSIEALHILADRLQSNLDRGTLGLHIAHLLAGKSEGTSDAVEALRLATPAPRPRGHLLATLRLTAHALHIDHARGLAPASFRRSADSCVQVYVVRLGAPIQLQVQLFINPSTTLRAIASQVEEQTVGLAAFVDISRQCVEIIEQVEEPSR